MTDGSAATDAPRVGDDAAAAPVAEVAGRSVPLHYGDPEAEYAALHDTAIVVDRSHRFRMRFTGLKAAEMLTGLLTNDVLSLVPGHGQYAAMLTPKGKILADARVFAFSAGSGAVDSLLVDTGPRAAAGFADTIRKYVNPRAAGYQDESAATSDFGVFGAQARRVVGAATGIASTALAALPAYGHLQAELDGASITVARVPELAAEGYELFVPTDAATALWDRLVEAGATPAGLTAFETARVESGRPEWGLDMDDGTIPQEANLDELHAISYTKGCYTGQETVARVHFRGHVNRHLRTLHFAGDVLPPPRAPLTDASGKPVGDVRSSARSPSAGGIAIAMVRREVAVGDTVRATWPDGEATATVQLLGATDRA